MPAGTFAESILFENKLENKNGNYLKEVLFLKKNFSSCNKFHLS
jgi:hypothetical protein